MAVSRARSATTRTARHPQHIGQVSMREATRIALPSGTRAIPQPHAKRIAAARFEQSQCVNLACGEEGVRPRATQFLPTNKRRPRGALCGRLPQPCRLPSPYAHLCAVRRVTERRVCPIRIGRGELTHIDSAPGGQLTQWARLARWQRLGHIGARRRSARRPGSPFSLFGMWFVPSFRYL